MFNFNINWNKIVKENLPVFFHTLFRLNWIKALIKPFKQIHQEFLIIREDYILKVAYNGQTLYLEKLLNDTFDNTLRRIYINDYGIINQNYLYKKSELMLPIYLYKNWDYTQAYLIGQYSVDGNTVYVALTNNTNQQPSTHVGSDWAVHKTITFFRKKVEYNISGGFNVNIPIGLVYDDARMRALIDYYRLASRLYVIVSY